MSERIEITLRYRSHVGAGERLAVLCNSDDPRRWLKALDEAKVDPLTARYALLPGQHQADPPSAALLFYPAQSVAAQGAGYQTYYQVVPKIWIPHRAELYPVPMENELKDLFSGDWTVWSPNIGWVSFKESDLLSVSDLFQMPEWNADRTWTLARSIPSPTHFIENVELTVESAEGALDILNSLQERRPLEELGESEPLKDPAWKQAFKNWGSHFIQKTLGKKSNNNSMLGASKSDEKPEAAKRSWRSKLTDWAQKTRDDISYQRMNELGRLVKLFEKDPREALKFAPSLSGLNRNRGEAPTPGGQLTRRNPTWSAEQYSKPGEIDSWSIPNEVSWRLRREYRRAAENAVKEGRFDEAAYVYAELLGDLHSAANVLKQGSRFQEAAYIYEKLLDSPELAASCLREGGYLTGAAKFFERCGMWERAGDAYREAGEVNSARRCFLKAVEKEADAGLQARILDEKLYDWKAACRVLLQDFPIGLRPKSSQARYWKILVRESQWEDLAHAVNGLSKVGSRIHPLSTQMENLIELFQCVHHEPSRELIRNQGIRLAGESIKSQSGQAEIRKTLNRLGALFPEDPSVALDAQRFLKIQDQSSNGSGATLDLDHTDDENLSPCRLLMSFTLQGEGTWKALATNGSILMPILNSAKNAAEKIFYSVDSFSPSTGLSGPFKVHSKSEIAAWKPLGRNMMVTHECDPGVYPFHVANQQMTLESAAEWVDPNQELTDSDDAIQAVLIQSGDGWALNLYEWEGKLVRSIALNLPANFDTQGLKTIRRKKKTCFYWEKEAYWIPDHGEPKVFSFDNNIRKIVATPGFTLTQFAVLTETHLILVQPNRPGSEKFLDETPSPFIRDLAVTLDNWVVLLIGQEMRLYKSGQGGIVRRKINLTGRNCAPIAVESAGTLSTIALLYPDGTLEIHRIAS